MWYVVQVITGSEERICEQCKKILSEQAMDSCFIPKYQEMRKLHGQWIVLEKRLFPGYVFLIHVMGKH